MARKVYKLSVQASWNFNSLEFVDGRLIHASQENAGDNRIDIWIEVDDEKVGDRKSWAMLVVSDQKEIPDGFDHVTSVSMRNGDAWHIYRKDKAAEVEVPELEPFAEAGPYTYFVNVMSTADRKLLFTAQASLSGVRNVVEQYADLGYNAMSDFMEEVMEKGGSSLKDVPLPQTDGKQRHDIDVFREQ